MRNNEKDWNRYKAPPLTAKVARVEITTPGHALTAETDLRMATTWLSPGADRIDRIMPTAFMKRTDQILKQSTSYGVFSVGCFFTSVTNFHLLPETILYCCFSECSLATS